MGLKPRVSRVVFDSAERTAEVTISLVGLDVPPKASDLPEDMRNALKEWLETT